MFFLAWKNSRPNLWRKSLDRLDHFKLRCSIFLGGHAIVVFPVFIPFIEELVMSRALSAPASRKTKSTGGNNGRGTKKENGGEEATDGVIEMITACGDTSSAMTIVDRIVGGFTSLRQWKAFASKLREKIMSSVRGHSHIRNQLDGIICCSNPRKIPDGMFFVLRRRVGVAVMAAYGRFVELFNEMTGKSQSPRIA